MRVCYILAVLGLCVSTLYAASNKEYDKFVATTSGAVAVRGIYYATPGTNALPVSLASREYSKFTTTSNGLVAVRVVLSDFTGGGGGSNGVWGLVTGAISAQLDLYAYLTNTATKAQGIAATNAQYRVGVLETNTASLVQGIAATNAQYRVGVVETGAVFSVSNGGISTGGVTRTGTGITITFPAAGGGNSSLATVLSNGTDAAGMSINGLNSLTVSNVTDIGSLTVSNIVMTNSLETIIRFGRPGVDSDSFIVNSPDDFGTVFGARNIIIGRQAGNAGINDNTIIGRLAGSGPVGDGNVFLGEYCGQAWVGGANIMGNACLGYGAGLTMSGCNNVYLGAYTGVRTEGASNNIAIGYNSGNQFFGSSNVFIGNMNDLGNYGSYQTYVHANTIGAGVLPKGNNTTAIGLPNATAYVDGSLVVSNIMYANVVQFPDGTTMQKTVLNGTNAMVYNCGGTNFYLLMAP